MHDVEQTSSELKELRKDLASLLVLTHEHLKLVDKALAGLPSAQPSSPAEHGVHFNGATWREIARAVAALPGLKPSLVRGYLNRGCKPVREKPRANFRLD